MFIHALRGTCLLAALASAGLWARSYYTSDVYVWRVRSAGAGFDPVHSRTIQTDPGRLIFQERTAVM